jgi:hypothetical protein
VTGSTWCISGLLLVPEFPEPKCEPDPDDDEGATDEAWCDPEDELEPLLLEDEIGVAAWPPEPEELDDEWDDEPP